MGTRSHLEVRGMERWRKGVTGSHRRKEGREEGKGRGRAEGGEEATPANNRIPPLAGKGEKLHNNSHFLAK